MTPLQIEMLLHFHCCGDPWPRLHAPACAEAINWFLSEGLIHDNNPKRYFLTERGEAYVKALCRMPLPVCHWVIPQEG